MSRAVTCCVRLYICDLGCELAIKGEVGSVGVRFLFLFPACRCDEEHDSPVFSLIFSGSMELVRWAPLSIGPAGRRTLGVLKLATGFLPGKFGWALRGEREGPRRRTGGSGCEKWKIVLSLGTLA